MFKEYENGVVMMDMYINKRYEGCGVDVVWNG